MKSIKKYTSRGYVLAYDSKAKDLLIYICDGVIQGCHIHDNKFVPYSVLLDSQRITMSIMIKWTRIYTDEYPSRIKFFKLNKREFLEHVIIPLI